MRIVTDMKRIAYIDRCIDGPDDGDSLLDKIRFEENRKITGRLGELYSLTAYHRLSDDTLRKMKEDCSGFGDYGTVITHVEADDYVLVTAKTMRQMAFPEREVQGQLDKTYDRSLGFIRKIKVCFPHARIIAYTGASPTIVPDKILHDYGVDITMRRWTPLSDSQLEKDLEQMIGCIEEGEIDYIYSGIWNCLEQRLNTAPINAGEPVLLFQEVGDGDNFMLLFNMPDINRRKFIVAAGYAGMSDSIHEDTFSMRFDGPELRGYRINEHIGEVSSPIKFFKKEGSPLYLSEDILEFDAFNVAFGRHSIDALMRMAESDTILRDEFHLLKYRPHIEDVLKKIEVEIWHAKE